MRFRDITRDVRLNLFRRKLRTGLTMAGIIIGALAVVTIVALGNGLSAFIDQQVRSVANPNIIEAWPTTGFNPSRIAQGIFSNLGRAPREIKKEKQGEFIGTLKINMLDFDTVEKIKEVKGVAQVKPLVFILPRSVQLEGDKREFETVILPWIQGGPHVLWKGRTFSSENAAECIVSEAYVESFGLKSHKELIGKQVTLRVNEHPVLSLTGQGQLDPKLVQQLLDIGRALNSPDSDTPVAIAEAFRLTMELIASDGFARLGSQEPELSEFPATIVGVAKKGLLANLIYVPDEYGAEMGRVLFRNLDLYTEKAYGIGAIVQIGDPEKISQVKRDIEKIGKLRVVTFEDYMGAIHKVFWTMQQILVIFGFIAFVVAAFSIVNTLLMAVFERKREIGVLKALGATSGTIRMLFAIEAAAIGFWGGVAGAVIGWLVCFLGNVIAKAKWATILGDTDIFLPPTWLFPVLLVFTTILGLLAGLYPAVRAARLDPMEALRYE
ncbi:MAG: FtsX-like permease family protein [Planctomycetota bacterium]|nr:MAG: FtsX-like permease family protein [Planctomycetota bacterium]